MSVIKKGKTFYGLYRAIGATDKLRNPEQISIIGIGKSKDGRNFEERMPFITPEEEWEKYGCERPKDYFFLKGNIIHFTRRFRIFLLTLAGLKSPWQFLKIKKDYWTALGDAFQCQGDDTFSRAGKWQNHGNCKVNTDMPPVKNSLWRKWTK